MPGSYLDRLDRLSPVLRKVSIEIVIGEFTQIGGKAVQPVQIANSAKYSIFAQISNIQRCAESQADSGPPPPGTPRRIAFRDVSARH
jgi:hypothetical protein